MSRSSAFLSEDNPYNTGYAIPDFMLEEEPGGEVSDFDPGLPDGWVNHDQGPSFARRPSQGGPRGIGLPKNRVARVKMSAHVPVVPHPGEEIPAGYEAAGAAIGRSDARPLDFRFPKYGAVSGEDVPTMYKQLMAGQLHSLPESAAMAVWQYAHPGQTPSSKAEWIGWVKSHYKGAKPSVSKAAIAGPNHAAAVVAHKVAMRDRRLAVQNVRASQQAMLDYVKSTKSPSPSSLAKLAAQHDAATAVAVEAAKAEAIAHVQKKNAEAGDRLAAANLPIWVRRILVGLVDMHTAQFNAAVQSKLGAVPSATALGWSCGGRHPVGIDIGIHPGRWAHEVVSGAKAVVHSAEHLAKVVGHDLKAAAKATGRAMKDAFHEITNLAKKGLCALSKNPNLIKAALAAGATAAGAPPTLALPSLGAGGLPPGFMDQLKANLPPGTSLPQLPSGGGSASTPDIVGKAGDIASSVFGKACPGDSPPPGMGDGGSAGIVLAGGALLALVALV